MLLEPIWHLLEEHVFPVASGSDLFNLYRDRHPEHDRPDAAAVRRDNLRRYLACYDERPAYLLLAEAPGPWGCRFSGVPFTSEAQLADEHFPVSGHPSGTTEEPHKEYSGGIYWRVMKPHFPQFFTWYTVPYHPHRPDEPMSIRAPRRSEIKAHLDLLEGVVACIEPECVLAIGRKAEYALGQIGVACRYVRHPSQGGATKFETGIREVFDQAGDEAS